MAIDRIIISGGGTGGHIFPALAIADEVKKRNPNAVIHFVGAKGRMEMQKIPARGYTITGLPIYGIQRRLTLRNLKVPFMLIASFFKALRIVQKIKPQVVVGVGGYASGPTLMAASYLGYPTVIQEQNSYPGITNKWLGRKAHLVCTAYPDLEKFFPGRKIKVLGNPVRSEIIEKAGLLNADEAKKEWGLESKPTLLVIGGSLGARCLNACLIQQYQQLLEKGYQLIWQTGEAFYRENREKIEALPKEGMVITAFIRDMEKAYAAADVVVSRAGALSISELSVVARPVIFVPSPYVAEDHQTKNASRLVDSGAAEMVAEKDVPEHLVDTALKLLSDQEKRNSLALEISKWAKPKATEDIVIELENVVNG